MQVNVSMKGSVLNRPGGEPILTESFDVWWDLEELVKREMGMSHDDLVGYRGTGIDPLSILLFLLMQEHVEGLLISVHMKKIHDESPVKDIDDSQWTLGCHEFSFYVTDNCDEVISGAWETKEIITKDTVISKLFSPTPEQATLNAKARADIDEAIGTLTVMVTTRFSARAVGSRRRFIPVTAAHFDLDGAFLFYNATKTTYADAKAKDPHGTRRSLDMIVRLHAQERINKHITSRVKDEEGLRFHVNEGGWTLEMCELTYSLSDELPNPRKIHHSCRVYNDGSRTYNGVLAEHLDDHIHYNRTMRFGCALFIDGVLMNEGYLTPRRCEVIAFELKVRPVVMKSCTVPYS